MKPTLKNVLGIIVIFLIILVFYKSYTLPNPGNYPSFFWTLFLVVLVLVSSYLIMSIITGKMKFNWTVFFINNCIGFLILLYFLFETSL